MILVALTVISVAIAEWMHQPGIIFFAAFGFAVAKGQLIAVHFMETKQATRIWSTLYRSWIVAIGCVLLLGNLLAPHGDRTAGLAHPVHTPP